MIPFNQPKYFGKISSIKKLSRFSSKGLYTKKCEKWLISNIKCKDAILVNSCTSALEMSALLLDIKLNDEIIMPSFTFVSTANAFVLRGGKPVFVDIDKETCNINPSKIEKAITKKTKAIVVVHYAGISCEMDTIIKIAKKHNLYIIEDAAQAIMSTYKGRPLGSIGDLATLSFHETKNIHCGEGGALLINNTKFIKRAKILRDKGTNRDSFDQKIVKKYTWVDYGSSYGLSEINATFLHAQLSQAKKIIRRRLSLFDHYHKLLKKLEIKKLIKRTTIPTYNKTNGHIYYIIIKNNKRDELIKQLTQKKINAVFHYIPLHSSPFGKLNTKIKSPMKNTNFVANNLLRLPMHLHLDRKIQVYIVKQIYNFFKEND
tara:strand:- start:48 stop:1169 length:1122 start_codon:yes stop_codon:yes gene_type:complete